MKKIFFTIILFTISISAQNVDERLSSAINLYDDHNFGAAYQLFTEVISENKLDEHKLILAKYYSADCLLNLNQFDGSASELEKFIDQYKNSNYRESALYKLGTIYIIKGEFRKARERLSTLMSEYKKSEYLGSAYYWIGEAYLAENKFVDAEENFREGISQKKTNKFIVNSFYSLAQSYERMNDFKSAVANYDELLAYYQEDPLAPKSQMRIGICYFNLKEYDNAILELTDPMIKKLPDHELVEAKFYLAYSYVRLKEYKEAEQVYIELLDEAKEISVSNKIKFSLGWIYFQQNNYNEAFKIFNGLSESTEDTLRISSLYWSGECKRYLGEEATAGAIFKQFLEKYPNHSLASNAQLGIGSLYFNKSNSSDAEKALLNATISDDKATRGRAYTLLGEMKLNRKIFNEAKKYFLEAVKLTMVQSELNYRASLGLAVSEFYLNNYVASVKTLEELKTRAKNFENDKVNFYLAESYFSQAEYSASLKNYNSIKSSSSDINKQTILGKAYAYFNLKDFPNSIYYFNEFLSKYKNDQIVNEVKLRLADSYFGSKNFEKASSIYRDLFSKENFALNNDLAYYQFAQSLFKAGKSDDAITAFKNLQEKFPRSKYVDESQYVIGWIHFQQNNFDEAITSYKTLLSKSPNSTLVPIAYYSIGDSYFNLGQYDSSIEFYSKVMEDFPNSQYIFDAVSGIQYAYVAKGQPENAMNFIDQFISSNPDSKYNDQLFFKKGDLLYSIEKYADAIKIYKEFISKYSRSTMIANAYYWIGKSAVNMKNESEAIEYFNNAKARSPKSDIGISSSVELATIYSNKKQYYLAVNVLKETADAVPTSNRIPELLYLQGINEVKDIKINDASATFEQLINYYEGSIFAAKAKVELGLLLLQQNNFEGAQLLLKEVGEKRTDDIGAQAQYYYGVSLFNQNKIEDAITALVRVRSVYAAYDEWYSRSLLKLGDCYLKIKDKKQAREMYRAVITKHPTGEFGIEAKRKLNQL